MSEQEKNFGIPGPEDDQRLTNKEAQEEANMLRAKMNIDIETGLKENKENPWTEEYDRALAEVEDLVRQAEAEPLSEKLIAALNRFIEEYRSVAEFLFTNRGKMTLEERDQSFRSAGQKHDALMEKLQDAAKKLKDLKQASNKYKYLPRE